MGRAEQDKAEEQSAPVKIGALLVAALVVIYFQTPHGAAAPAVSVEVEPHAAPAPRSTLDARTIGGVVHASNPVALQKYENWLAHNMRWSEREKTDYARAYEDNPKHYDRGRYEQIKKERFAKGLRTNGSPLLYTGDHKPHPETIHPITPEAEARYKDWVENNLQGEEESESEAIPNAEAAAVPNDEAAEP